MKYAAPECLQMAVSLGSHTGAERWLDKWWPGYEKLDLVLKYGV